MGDPMFTFHFRRLGRGNMIKDFPICVDKINKGIKQRT